MWTLLVPVAVVIATIVVLGLFKAAGLNRPEDLVPPPETDEWDLRNYSSYQGPAAADLKCQVVDRLTGADFL
jgi:hypothetical protein